MSKRFRSDDEPQDFGFLASPNEGLNIPMDDPAEAIEASPNLTTPAEMPSTPSVAESTQPLRPPAESQAEKPAIPRKPFAADVPAASQGNASTADLSVEASEASKATRRLPLGLVIYSAVVTLLLIYFMLTGKSSRLESLPDIRLLKGNEFQQVPESAQLPDGHTLKLGQSTRFGDVLVTPVKVTREPLTFENFMTKEANPNMTTPPVLKLHLTMKNVASDYAFPPFDSGLMSHRSPPEADDDSAKANSFLRVVTGDASDGQRFLNFLQSMDNPFLLIGQNSAKPIAPGETIETFVASSVAINSITLDSSAKCTWRVQIRKGVNIESGNGVTTLIDVVFSGSDVQTL